MPARRKINDMGVAVREPASKLLAEEYSKLPEMIGFKDELIEGERVLAPMPKFSHTVVIDNLESLLRRQFSDMRIVREAGWHFQSVEGLENVPGPDLMVLRPEDYDHTARSGAYFEGCPVFVVEVVSPSERRSRRLQKAGLYLEAGAGAVVEVDYTKRSLIVYRPEEHAPDVIRDRIAWPFTASLSDLFAHLG
ncbi:MAG: Uma2 family endonuclease [Bryobacteraceae bacterium]